MLVSNKFFKGMTLMDEKKLYAEWLENATDDTDLIEELKSIEGDAEAVREFASLAEEFEGDVGQDAVFLFGEDPDLARFVRLFHGGSFP